MPDQDPYAAAFDQAPATPDPYAAAFDKPSSQQQSDPYAAAFNSASGRSQFAPLIAAAEQQYNIPAGLLDSLIKHESGYNPTSVSSKGAIGLGQLMPGTAATLHVDPTDPAQNIDGSARFLADQLKTFGGNPKLALAAYNAGSGAVHQYGGVPPYPETQRYIKAVLADVPGLAALRQPQKNQTIDQYGEPALTPAITSVNEYGEPGGVTSRPKTATPATIQVTPADNRAWGAAAARGLKSDAQLRQMGFDPTPMNGMGLTEPGLRNMSPEQRNELFHKDTVQQAAAATNATNADLEQKATDVVGPLMGPAGMAPWIRSAVAGAIVSPLTSSLNASEGLGQVFDTDSATTPADRWGGALSAASNIGAWALPETKFGKAVIGAVTAPILKGGSKLLDAISERVAAFVNAGKPIPPPVASALQIEASRFGGVVTGIGEDGRPIIRIRAEGNEVPGGPAAAPDAASTGAATNGKPASAPDYSATASTPAPDNTPTYPPPAAGARRVTVNGNTYDLQGPALTAWQQAEDAYQSRLAQAAASQYSDQQASLSNAAAMQWAAAQRDITGELTAREAKQAAAQASKLTPGVDAIGPDGRAGTVKSNAFGRVTLQYDDGSTMAHPWGDVSPAKAGRTGAMEGATKVEPLTPTLAPEPVGVGAASQAATPKPTATAEAPQSTGIANQVLNREGATWKPAETVTPEQAHAAGAGTTIQEATQLAESLARKDVPLTPENVGKVLEGKRLHDLNVNNAAKALDAAIKGGDQNEITTARSFYNSALDAQQKYIDAFHKGVNTQWHNIGMAMQAGTGLDEGNFAQVIQEATRAKGGALSDADTAKFQGLTKAAADLKAKLQAALDRNSALEAERRAGWQRTTQRKANVAVTKQQLDDEFQNLGKQLLASGAKLSAGLDPDLAKVIGKMVGNRLRYAGVSVSDAVATTLEHIKGIRPDLKLTERDVRDAYSGYGYEGKPLSEAARVGQAGRRVASSMSELEDVKAGVAPPKRAAAPVSDQVKKLIEQNLAIRQQIRRSIADQAPKSLATKIGNYTRENVLTTPAAVEHILGSGLWNLATEPAESLLGKLAGKLPSGTGATLGDLAPAYGKATLKSEGQGLKGLFSRQTLSDMGASVKGENPIDLIAQQGHGQLGGGVAGRIHSMMQAPALRKNYEIAFSREIDALRSSGADLTNQTVQEGASLRASKYALDQALRGDNVSSKAMNNISRVFQQDPETGSKMMEGFLNVLMPVRKLAYNYVGKSIDYTGAGVLKGAVNHIGAARAGTMTREMAGKVIGQYARGGLGAAAIYLGLAQPDWLKSAGYYREGASKTSSNSGLKPEEMQFGGGTALGPHTVWRAFSHSPFANAVQFWATVRHAYDDYHSTDAHPASTERRIEQALTAPIPGLIEQTPGGQPLSSAVRGRFAEAAGQLAKEFIPAEGLAGYAARQMDTQGQWSPVNLFNPHPRPVQDDTVTKSVREGIPLVRNTLPPKAKKI